MSNNKEKKLTAIYGGGVYAERKHFVEKSVTCDLWRKSGFALRGFQKILEPFSDFEKLSLLYAMIASECTYDNTIKRHFTRSYIGALRDRCAVCAAFAELLMLLIAEVTNYKNIYYVVGKTNPKSESYHAWNIIEMDGQSFHLDLTWDLQKSRPKYFLKSDQEMKPRVWDKHLFPSCTKKFNGTIYQNDKALEKLRRYFRKLESSFKTTGDFTVD